MRTFVKYSQGNVNKYYISQLKITDNKNEVDEFSKLGSFKKVKETYYLSTILTYFERNRAIILLLRNIIY